MQAFSLMNEKEVQLESVAKTLKTSVSELHTKASGLMKKFKSMEKDIEVLKLNEIKGSICDVIAKAENFKDVKLITHCFVDVETNILRKVIELISQKEKSSIILIGANTADSTSILLSISDEYVKKGLNANEIIKEISTLINGSGGGRPKFAQAGSKEKIKLEPVINHAVKVIKDNL